MYKLEDVILKDFKPDPKAVGLRIKEIRFKLGYSMAEFARHIDDKAKSGTVSNWETGKNLPNNKRLKRIAELGDVSLLYLLKGEKTIVDLSDKEKLELSIQLKKTATSYNKIRDDYVQAVIDYFNDNVFSDMNDEEIILIGRLITFINEMGKESVNSLEFLIRLINRANKEDELNSDTFKKLYKEATENLLDTLQD
ncbi:helix-turn-helix transcriptional regulator [Enterococcus faecalis]|nr:helix-turn-helix transcriptional regulator [Enterococcus faecalis]